MNLKKILVPTDFSEPAQAAGKIAAQISELTGAEIHLLHSANSLLDWVEEDHMFFDSGVLPDDLPRGVVKEVNEGLLKAESLLDDAVRQLGEQGVTVRKHLKVNLTHQGITEFSEKEKVDLIIMGTSGTTGFVDEMMGSNAQKIARSAKCPVIFVKGNVTKLRVEKLLFPSTFEEKIELENLAKAKEFADMIDAKVDLLFVNTPHYFEETKPCLDRLNKVKDEYGLNNSDVYIYDHFTPEDGILAFAEQNKYDMICMSKFQFSGWKQLSKPFVTEPVINHANVPVLSLYVNTQ